MNITTIIWDLGGVLVRTEDLQPRKKLAQRLGVPIQKLAYLTFEGSMGQKAQTGEITRDELWEYIRSELSLTVDEIVQVEKEWWMGDKLDYALVDKIRNLKLNYTTALLSNAWNDLRYVMADIWHIDDAFHTMVISAEEGIVKPNPAIYHLALERTGGIPSEAVFIDDFAENIVGAQAVGMHGIHFQTAEQAWNDLQQLLNNKP